MFNRILFSAVGGTDPIANYKDGPILHICRVYRPSVVVLYLSAEMCIAQEKDKRFTYVLEQLCEHLHFKMDIRLMQDTELHDVHHFDVIIPNFAKQLESLLEEFPDAEVMLNLSSGTPAMKSAFHTLSAFYPDRTKGIQVWTPKKRMNQVEEDRINYDVESYWELNEDNAEDFQNRCVEAETIQLLAKHKRGIVKQLIRMMDYRGAWQVAMDIQDEISEIARYGILWAAERYDLNYHKMMDLQKQYGEFYRLPDKHDDRRNTVEYILSTKARAERQAYVDFLRALTPLIVELFERLLIHYLKIDIPQYYQDSSDRKRWSENKLRNSEIEQILQEGFKYRFQYGDVSSMHLAVILENHVENARVKSAILRLREVETKARNLVAHQMVSVDAEWIEAKTGMTPDAIVETILFLAKIGGLEKSKDVWNSYQEMNKSLLRLL